MYVCIYIYVCVEEKTSLPFLYPNTIVSLYRILSYFDYDPFALAPLLFHILAHADAPHYQHHQITTIPNSNLDAKEAKARAPQAASRASCETPPTRRARGGGGRERCVYWDIFFLRLLHVPFLFLKMGGW